MRSPSPLAVPATTTAAAAAAAAVLALGAALAFVSTPLAAQRNRQQPDVVRGVAGTPEGARAGAAFVRAQRLVAEGQGPAGRAVVDSTLAATPPKSPVYAEGLFWRASLAATAADAERDYRTLAVEYSMSPRSADALLRLAQLEMARGDRDLAVKHLERLTLEHPTSPARARASYWMARVYFEASDLTRACTALSAARSGAAPAEIGLRAQIDAYAPRCKDGSSGATTAVAARTTTDTTPAVRPGTATGLTTQTAAGARNSARDTSSIFGGAAVVHAPAVATTAASASPESAPPSSAPARVSGAARVAFSVQLAAFDAAAPAEAMVARLRGRGLDARVSGVSAPFRVRIGRYATSGAAARAAAALKARGQPAFVVDETVVAAAVSAAPR